MMTRMITRDFRCGMYIAKRRRNGWKRSFLFRNFTNRALIIFLVLFLMILSLFFATSALAAENEKPKQKTIVSVCIAPGDNLWSIAQEYYSAECGSFSDYVAEIKRSNGLRGDTIHTGAYLIVPYYADILNQISN